MLFGLLIDYICRIFLAVLGVIVLAFIVTTIVIIIGEKNKWW